MCLNANIIEPSNIIILGKRLNFYSNKKNCMNELKKMNHLKEYKLEIMSTSQKDLGKIVTHILELLRPSNNH
ncbi:hypothetical protein L208DRAFT_1406831 [Tricholoma matsutake]|nr:hypothetical protein L208DRAFT_1406831 [Tricholoma matsutake 945]